jgi:hypothetical protein
MPKRYVPVMKCSKRLPIYVLNWLIFILPLLGFSFEISKQKLEQAACSQIRDLYPDVTCKGIIFYGKKLVLEGENYLLMVKKSGNSFLLEVVDAQTLKPVRVIPIKTVPKYGRKTNSYKKNLYGKKVKVIFVKGNIRVETSGIIIGKGFNSSSVRVKVGKKYFEGVLQNEDTVIVKLY